MKTAILIAACLVLSWGCGTVDVDKVRAQLAQSKQAVETLAAAAKTLTALAESTGDDKIIAMAGAAQKALEIAQQQIPLMEAAVKAAQGRVPWWSLVIPFAVQYGPRALQLIPGVAAIPGISVALEVIARFLANGGWAAAATKKQKQDDDAIGKL